MQQSAVQLTADIDPSASARAGGNNRYRRPGGAGACFRRGQVGPRGQGTYAEAQRGRHDM